MIVIKGSSFFDGIEKLVKNLSKGNATPLGGVTIKIKTKPEEKKTKLKMPTNKVIEPKTEIKKIGNELEIIIELPGIKSLKNIDLMSIGESIEVRAVNKNKGYFKLLSVPEDYEIIQKKLNNEVLSIRMGEKQ